MTLLRQLLAPVFVWAQQKSRVGLGLVASLPGADAASFRQPRMLPIGIPTDASHPKQADVLVVVGQVSHKLAPFVIRAHAAMAQPAHVLWFDLDAQLYNGYATLHALDAVMPVDVIVRGPHPSAQSIVRALAALDERSRS